jgi:ABC-2 type transport system ATP-binding protein
MSEIAVTAEHLVVIGRGRMIADTTVAEIVTEASKGGAVHVRTPDAGRLRSALAGEDVAISGAERATLEVSGLTSERIGEIAAREGIVLHELTPQKASLEDAFMRLTGESVEYHAADFDPATTQLEHAA